MATVKFIIGLCGSGKSWHYSQLASNFELKYEEGFCDNKLKQQESLIDALRSGKNCLVAEMNYCYKENRQEIITKLTNAIPKVIIEWLCIENDLLKANQNCHERTNKNDPEGKGHIEINNIVSPDYTYPDGGEIIKMWTK